MKATDTLKPGMLIINSRKVHDAKRINELMKCINNRVELSIQIDAAHLKELGDLSKANFKK